MSVSHSSLVEWLDLLKRLSKIISNIQCDQDNFRGTFAELQLGISTLADAVGRSLSTVNNTKQKQYLKGPLQQNNKNISDRILPKAGADFYDLESKITSNDVDDLDYGKVILYRNVPTLDEYRTLDEDFNVTKKIISSVENFSQTVNSFIDAQNINLPHVVSPTSSLSDLRTNDMNSERAALTLQKVYRGKAARKQFKGHARRRMIAIEIFETELSYVKGLFALYSDYFLAIQYRFDIGKPVIHLEQFSIIFFYIREILLLNRELLTNIAKRVQNWNAWSEIGSCFLEFVRFFNIS